MTADLKAQITRELFAALERLGAAVLFGSEAGGQCGGSRL
jgi:hypothetical protein